MNCEHFIEKLYLYIDGELSSEEEQELEEHLAECINCLRIYGLELQFKKTVVEKLRHEEVPVRLVEKIRITLRSI
jgi:mycothiol system anti-sigma-R factor